jgi:hypothetical protein
MVMPKAALAQEDRAGLARTLAPIFGHDLSERPPVVISQLRAMSSYGDMTPGLCELAGLPTLVIAAPPEDLIAPALRWRTGF